VKPASTLADSWEIRPLVDLEFSACRCCYILENSAN
jgi:hypothetical protein